MSSTIYLLFVIAWFGVSFLVVADALRSRRATPDIRPGKRPQRDGDPFPPKPKPDKASAQAIAQAARELTPVKVGCTYCGRPIPLSVTGDCPGCGAPLQAQVEKTPVRVLVKEERELLDAGWSIMRGDNRVIAAHHPDYGVVRFVVDGPRVDTGIDLGGYSKHPDGTVCRRDTNGKLYCLRHPDTVDPRLLGEERR